MDRVRLGAFVDILAVKDSSGGGDPLITSIHYDSRHVAPGALFVAIKGLRADGHDYVKDAVQRGAVAVVTEHNAVIPAGTSVVRVENSRRALSALSAAFYGNPSHQLFVIGITGTNGKTTTAYLIEAILTAAGYAVGVIGTINYRFKGHTFHNAVTTPESLDLMRIMRQMADAGVTHVVMEVSSHALDLDRVSSCEFDVGVFTNLSPDHLDYHGDMDAYWQCKKRLCLDYLASGAKYRKAAAVVNCDDRKGKELASQVPVRCLRTGFGKGCDIRGRNVQTTIKAGTGMVQTPQGSFEFTTPLIGRHNVYNILTATGVASAMGIPLNTIKSGVESLQGVPGRLESIANDAGRYVLVDYAHTPDALEKVLATLRGLTDGRLITVFGCGGDRDRAKRPMMGETAGRISDLVVLTNDNPRTEEPQKILGDIEKGVVRVHDNRLETVSVAKGFNSPGYTVEPDRRKAIALGISASRPGDTVLVAGKGHETYQIIGSNTVDFDDRVEAGKVLARLSTHGEA